MPRIFAKSSQEYNPTRSDAETFIDQRSNKLKRVVMHGESHHNGSAMQSKANISAQLDGVASENEMHQPEAKE
jgi:hypothetical protein